MLRDITIGQYYPVKSFVHLLDARLKIILAFLYIVSLFMVQSISLYIVVVIFVGMAIVFSQVPISYMLRGLIILIILIFLIVGTSLLTLTTSPIELTDGLEYLLNPFKKIGVPAHELAMMMTIALRFIPTLLEETNKIMNAQMARGADFESGNLFSRAKSLVPLLVPLFISAFRRADELAMAMEARCYRGGENRTRMKVLTYTRRDGYALSVFIMYIVILLGVQLYINFA